MSEYNQIEYPITYFLWLFFSIMLTGLIILYSAVFSKYLLLVYLRSFLGVFTADINYAFGMPDGSRICVPTRGLLQGGIADITFYQTYDKTWATVSYTVKNPVLRTVGTIRVSAPIFGYFATNYDPVSGKYLAVNYFENIHVNGTYIMGYKSPYSDYIITQSKLTNNPIYFGSDEKLMYLRQTYITNGVIRLLQGNNSVVDFNGWLFLWYKDVGSPIAVCFVKKDGLLIIEKSEEARIIG